jgi:hypothetical protein
MVGTCVDITERKRRDEERQAHLWFLESMDRINRAIQSTNDLEQMMSDVLDAVLSIFACDRAWLVYPCDPESRTWRPVMERTCPAFSRAIQRIQAQSKNSSFPANWAGIVDVAEHPT